MAFNDCIRIGRERSGWRWNGDKRATAIRTAWSIRIRSAWLAAFSWGSAVTLASISRCRTTDGSRITGAGGTSLQIATGSGSRIWSSSIWSSIRISFAFSAPISSVATICIASTPIAISSVTAIAPITTTVSATVTTSPITSTIFRQGQVYREKMTGPWVKAAMMKHAI